MIQLFDPLNLFDAWQFALVAPVGIIGALIGLGGSLLGGIFNRESQESKDAKRAQARLANQQAKLAKARGARESTLFAESQPIVGTLTSQLNALLSGDREALTKRFAPQLEALAGQRQRAEERIRQGGPAGGASVQGLIELEKSNFAERNRLLSSAPGEATAGLGQLLELLLGSSAQQGAGATQAASVAGGALNSILSSEAANRASSQGFFSSLVQGATTFGRGLFKPGVESPGGPGADISGLASGGLVDLPSGAAANRGGGRINQLLSPGPVRQEDRDRKVFRL